MDIDKAKGDAFFAAITEAEKQAKAIITDELTGQLKALEKAEADAAAHLQECHNALDLPVAHIMEIDAGIAEAQAEVNKYAAASEDGDMHAQVEARRWLSEWQEQVSRLKQKKAQSEDHARPLVADLDAASDALKRAKADRETMELNIRLPFYAYGQRTEAYQVFRLMLSFPALVIMAGNDEHHEYGAAREFLVSLAKSAGITADELEARQPSNLALAAAELARDAVAPPHGIAGR